MCQRERESASVCVCVLAFDHFVCESVQDSVCMCVCFVRERDRERERECVRASECVSERELRERECVCVCVCVRESVNHCVLVSVVVYARLFSCVCVHVCEGAGGNIREAPESGQRLKLWKGRWVWWFGDRAVAASDL